MSWLTYGFDSQRTGYNPSERIISPANEAGRHELWSVNLGGVMLAPPVEAAAANIGGKPTNVVYEGTEHAYVADFGATPVVFRRKGCRTLAATKQKSGVLFVYTAGNPRGGYRQKLQLASADDWRFNGLPAWDPATSMLYVSNSTDSTAGVYPHGIVALKVGINCSLSLAWQKSVPVPYKPPAVVNGQQLVASWDGYLNAFGP